MYRCKIVIIVFVLFIAVGCNRNGNNTVSNNSSTIKTEPSVGESTKTTPKESKVETTSKKTCTTNTPTKKATKQITTRQSEIIIEEEFPEISDDHIFAGDNDINSDITHFLKVTPLYHQGDYLSEGNSCLINIKNLFENRKSIISNADVFTRDKLTKIHGDYDNLNIEDYNIIFSRNMERYTFEFKNESTKEDFIKVYDSTTNELIIYYDYNRLKDNSFEFGDFNNSMSQTLIYKFSELTNRFSFYLLDLLDGSIIDIGLEDVYGYYNFSPYNNMLYCNYRFKNKDYILIYDIERKVYVKAIDIGSDRFIISQWSEQDKILYTTYQYANNKNNSVSDINTYIYDLKTDEQKIVGRYMLLPQMSKDGRFIVYYYQKYFSEGVLISKSEYLYEYPIYTLNIKDLETNKVFRVPNTTYRWSEKNGFQDNSWVWEYNYKYYYIDSSFEIDESLYIDDYENENYNEYGYSDASSYLDHNYNPYNIKDGDKTTCWAEDQESQNFSDLDPDGSGIGEWVYFSTVRINKDTDFSYEVEKNLKGFKIINGYAKSESTYNTNNRVKEVEIEFSDKQRMTFNLEDNNMDFQTFYFPEEIKTRYFKLFIRDIYKGTKYNDTCISEIELIESDKGK
jgi:hypothetical protein